MRILFLIGLIGIIATVQGQQKCFVKFTNKELAKYTPEMLLPQKVLQKKLQNGLPLIDYYDIPVTQAYINQIAELGFEISTVSTWLNGVFVNSNAKGIQQLKQLSCVVSVTKSKVKGAVSLYNEGDDSDDLDSLQTAQIQEFNGQLFIDNNINGQGITIAIFDGGFPGVDVLPEFAHIRDSNKILATYDFVRRKEFVYSYNKHGTMVLSCIAGINNTKNMGLATGANFLLARTEKNTEPLSEEENWLAAVEWAYANGADIINSSLGYTFHRYFRHDMDGHVSLVSEAARIAARKGILVVNAMGNDGSGKWHFLSTPADVDSVMSVGGIDPKTGMHINFSSFGPNAKRERKPNVSAFGEAVVCNKTGRTKASGTSFSTPLVAGFAACVWQMNPELCNMEVFKLIEQSGHLYPYFDYAHGYGVPKANYFFEQKDSTSTTFEINSNNFDIDVYLSDELLDKAESDLLYWHIQKPDGSLRKFQVVKVYSNIPLSVKYSDLSEGETLRVYFNNSIQEFKK